MNEFSKRRWIISTVLLVIVIAAVSSYSIRQYYSINEFQARLEETEREAEGLKSSYALAGYYLYVPNTLDGTVSVVDLLGDRIVATITVGASSSETTSSITTYAIRTSASPTSQEGTTTLPTSTIDYEALLTRKDQGEGGVSVEAVLLTKDYLLAKGEDPGQYDLDRQIAFKITVDTHAGSLLEYNFKELFFLRDDKGNVYTPLEWRDISLDSHHRSGTLTFSRFDARGNPIINDGVQFIELVVKNIAKVPERTLRWNLPIPN